MKIEKLTILAVVGLVAAFIAFGPGKAIAAHCDVTIDKNSSIQAAVDAAISGDVVCLDDSAGDFNQVVVFSGTDGADDDSGITLSAEDGDTPVLDGTPGPLAVAITLKDGVRGVTIEDLEIRDYTTHAIDGDGTTGTPLSRITLRDLDIHDIDFHAIDILFSNKVRIERLAIVVTSAAAFPGFAEAIRLQSVNRVTVEQVAIVGGFVGVNFACSGACSGPEPPTNGAVRNSTIFDTLDNGVLLANTTNAKVENNVIAEAGFGGIQVGFRSFNPVTGVRIFQNVVTSTAGDGILLTRGSSGSTVLSNIVTGSTGGGIVVVLKAPGGTSTDNVIRNNVSDGNTGFGYSDDTTGGGTAGTDNTYVGNECKANTAGGSSSDGVPTATGDLCTPQF